MKPRIEFSEDKNLLLKATKQVCFEDVITAIEKGDVLDDLNHVKNKYPNQKILVIKINDYAYAVPYVVDRKRGKVFLKTVYPSRVLTRKYLKGGKKNENEK